MLVFRYVVACAMFSLSLCCVWCVCDVVDVDVGLPIMRVVSVCGCLLVWWCLGLACCECCVFVVCMLFSVSCWPDFFIAVADLSCCLFDVCCALVYD